MNLDEINIKVLLDTFDVGLAKAQVAYESVDGQTLLDFIAWCKEHEDDLATLGSVFIVLEALRFRWNGILVALHNKMKQSVITCEGDCDQCEYAPYCDKGQEDGDDPDDDEGDGPEGDNNPDIFGSLHEAIQNWMGEPHG